MGGKALFTSFEYLESFRERVSTIDSFARDLQGHLKLLEGIDFISFKKKCEIILDSSCSYFKDLLEYLESVNILLQEKIEKIFIEHKKLDSYDDALRALEVIINQRIISPNYEENAFPEYLFGCYHPRVARAIDKLVRYLTDIFFESEKGTNNNAEGICTQILPLTVFGNSPRHQISTIRLFGKTDNTILLFLVNIPKTDAYRYRFLTSLCHEISHVKLRLTWQSSLLKEADLYLSYPEAGQKLYDEILDELQSNIMKVYKTSKIYEDDFVTRNLGYVGSISEQVEEILADFACLTIFGLADLCTLICWSGDPAQELEEKKLRPIDHPPLPVRVNYMLEYLKSLDDEEPEYKNTLNEIEQNWMDIEKSNQDLVPFKEFLDSYKEAVSKSSKKIVEFTEKYLMPNSKQFEPKIWGHYVSIFNQEKILAENSKKIETPVTRIIRAWAKRWCIYRKLFDSDNQDLCKFFNWHKTETKLLGQMINELNQ